eukprot:TRINITY_DN8476_c0_g1_i1.p1 TRINITY_DN8476_c0_g1~~TRINITY_DN8476_c0_g1_i1.p1  ORF type:complete len:518 (+),score=96.73 TRINITY_DN8476_c0_g1_i1:77-1630(+)
MAGKPPETAGGKRSTVEGAKPQEPAKKRPTLAAAKKAEIVALWKGYITKAVAENGWEGAKSVLDDAVAVAQGKGGRGIEASMGAELPHLPYSLYCELSDIAPDDILERVVDYMHQQHVVDLCRNIAFRHRTIFLEGMLGATKAIGHRCLFSPEIAGKAQLLHARVGFIRHDVSVLLKHVFRHNETLNFAKVFSPPDPQQLTDTFSQIRSKKDHNLPTDAVAKHIKDLQVLSQRIANVPENGETLVGVGDQVHGLTQRLLQAVKDSYANCKQFAAKTSVDTPSKVPNTIDIPRIPSGEWSVVSLQDSKQQLVLLLMIQVTVGTVLMKCLDELSNYNPSRPHGRQREVLQTATKLWGSISNIETHIADSLGSERNGKVTGQQIARKEFFREAVWNTWKRFGCPAKPFEGASAAITEMEALRKAADAKSRPPKVQQTLLQRTFSNTPPNSMTLSAKKLSSLKNILQASDTEPTVPEGFWEVTPPLPQRDSEVPAILEFSSILQPGDVFRTVTRFPTCRKE